jgi:hypothetical protein
MAGAHLELQAGKPSPFVSCGRLQRSVFRDSTDLPQTRTFLTMPTSSNEPKPTVYRFNALTSRRVHTLSGTANGFR